jgi:ribonuclease P protein component
MESDSHIESGKALRKFFKKYQRIRLERDFEALKGASVDFKTRYFAIKMLVRDEAEGKDGTAEKFQGPRIGVVASKRVGNAVVRNRAKRRARELARLHQHELRVGIDLLFILRTAMVRADWKEIESTWLWAMRKIGALKG